ncbi:hypothetical protein CDA63_03940 [Hymenobacter amundsenii]|uniref:Uncharacterized protein n=1 Tax=Hymenobacter amundsenii TaxID=2006685 RepID=A0A246FPB6_9BACT|nr:hypothetical protein [Hymenobacter amundsenii]OWP64529.1 hypothetical protein CDA63_03940 [Hymenobacter amundsenii]
MDNLESYFHAPLAQVLGKNLQACFYHDVFDQKFLTTNGKGVDIVAHQIELLFDDNQTIFISWANIDGWHQYSLSVSNKSFCVHAERYSANPAFWQHYIGASFSRYEIYGYATNQIDTHDSHGLFVQSNYYFNEPHLILLYFDNVVVGVANFYLEENFIPRLPMGDDVWILFDPMSIQLCIKKLGLEKFEA